MKSPAALDVGKQNAQICLEPCRPQIPRRVEQRKIEFVDRREKRQDRIGQIHVDKDEDDGSLIVQKLDTLSGEVQSAQNIVQEPFIPQDGDPRIDAHEEVGPKRHYDQKKPDGLIF